MKNDEILVSIFCITYNHKNYIKDCLDGFVSQKTSFKFMAFVGDDGSTDGTSEIIKEYEAKFPHIIKGIYHDKNMGVWQNSIDVANACKSKYVALCEGDDYFTDENKLQKQVEFMEANPNYSICFHPVRVIYEGFDKAEQIYPIKQDIWSFETLLRWNFIQTNSALYRWKFQHSNFADFMPKNILPGDWYMHLLHAKGGEIKCLKDTMSVYRRNKGGMWSDGIEDEDNLFAKYALQQAKFYACVYENIADFSPEYLQNVLVPSLKKVTKALIKKRKFGTLSELNEIYPNFINLAFKEQENLNTQNDDRFKKKFKKYKKRFKIACALGFALLLADLVLLFG